MEEAETMKRYSLLQAERMAALNDKAMEQVVKVSGWLSASLLAVNSGGALTALQSIEKLRSPWTPIAFFGSGILLSMGSAVLIQHFLSRAMPKSERAIQIAREIAVGMALDDRKFAELCEVSVAPKGRWLPPLSGWLSAMAFVAGGLTLVADLSHHKATSTIAQPAGDKHVAVPAQGGK